MKTLALSILFLGGMLFSSIRLNAQKPETLTTESFTVSGNCEMCKAKIEKAAKAGGATKAVWNPDNKILVVSYNKEKLNIDAIHQSIAKVGYDTDKIKATDKKYKALPTCCQYDRTTDVTSKTVKKN
ncbi:MAG TPA: cation transporter [Saprospiraceae bacterium]|nr:cation transporter [Saprospiraceae bacterium]